MVRFAVFLALAAHVVCTLGLAFAPVPVARANNATADGFVSVNDGNFQLNGKFFRFYGTNAYYVQMMTDYDLDMTFHDIASAGYKVVRTWAFNDVPHKPAGGTYFQILSGGKATINKGGDGLERLDKVVAAAKRYGVKLVLTLTNNWNPERTLPDAFWNRREELGDILPRGYLANDYGGIDAYVRAFNPSGTHDLFYTDKAIIDAFKDYVKAVVTRYDDNPTVLAWELGNDLRCYSTIKASSSCTTKTITQWAADISAFIKKIDPKHLITVGDAGFYCLKCPKLYAKSTTPTQAALQGPSFDGSHGIDSDDLTAIPTIDFTSIQISPEQIQLFPRDESEPFAVQAIQDGGKWIDIHSQGSKVFKKPTALLAAGVVTKTKWKFYVPNTATQRAPDGTPCQGVEDYQQTYAFTWWASASLNGNVDGMLEWQWLQNGLTSHGTTHAIWDKRDGLEDTTPEPGHYNGAANGMNAEQYAASLPKIE